MNCQIRKNAASHYQKIPRLRFARNGSAADAASPAVSVAPSPPRFLGWRRDGAEREAACGDE